MTLTYPENIRLLGPSSWEEMRNQQTNRQTAHRNSTPLSRIMHVANPRRAKRALGSEGNSSCVLLIDSEMAGPIKLKLGGMVEGMQENVLAKEFF